MNKNQKGISKGLVSAITWGIDTVISGIILSMPPFRKVDGIMLFAPLVVVFVHDFVGGLWLLLYLAIRGRLGLFIKSLRKKEVKYAVLAGIFGGPVGMSGYYLSIKYLGPSYAAALSSVYPIMGAVFAAIFLKEKLGPRGWGGMIISVIGVVLLSMEGSSGAFNMTGLIFAIMPIIGWGSESIICSIGMQNEELRPIQVLTIRQLVSGISFGVIVLPLIGGYGVLKSMIFDRNTILLAILVSLIGAVSLGFYYISIHSIGPVKAMIINITYVIWSLLLSAVLLGSSITFQKVIYIAIIFAGSLLVIFRKSAQEGYKG
ncbi:DMT family transporter [uncultured Clostridium sp.]|jgi:drug/metabolite transporter (DMT)-like permease|uniref:DMT family transporter n=1 Tax=uncultured Clostridium sp. TaxID=59620 RepID=UPI002632496D|nr:DMT family transporter [uncultured Clostridium sp.]